jgi:hypothetical protein
MLDIIEGTFRCDFCGDKYYITDERYDIQPVISHKNCITIPPINICGSCYNKIMDYFEDGEFKKEV